MSILSDKQIKKLVLEKDMINLQSFFEGVKGKIPEYS